MARYKKDDQRTTEQQQEDVLTAFSDTANITEACKKANIPRRTFYNWLKFAAFKKKFKSQADIAVGVLEDEAKRRAVTGTLKPVYYLGKKVGSIREYSDTLLIVLLKAHAPEKYKERFVGELSGKNGQPIQTETTVKVINASLDL